MAIKAIVELQAKPGRRDELKGVLEILIAAQGPGQAREAHMREAAATGAYAPLLELLAVPFRVMFISQLP